MKTGIVEELTLHISTHAAADEGFPAEEAARLRAIAAAVQSKLKELADEAASPAREKRVDAAVASGRAGAEAWLDRVEKIYGARREELRAELANELQKIKDGGDRLRRQGFWSQCQRIGLDPVEAAALFHGASDEAKDALLTAPDYVWRDDRGQVRIAPLLDPATVEAELRRRAPRLAAGLDLLDARQEVLAGLHGTFVRSLGEV